MSEKVEISSTREGREVPQISTLEISQDETQGQKLEKFETYWFKRQGNSIFLVSDKNGNPYFTIGPDWKIFATFISIVTVIYLSILITQYHKYSYVFRVVGVVSYFSYSLTYFATFIINPGIPKNTEGKFTGLPLEDYRFCELCRYYVIKKNLVSHCSICTTCVEDYDHHCPWVGKCVGGRNKCTFNLFLLGTLAIFGFFFCAAANSASYTPQ